MKDLDQKRRLELVETCIFSTLKMNFGPIQNPIPFYIINCEEQLSSHW